MKELARRVWAFYQGMVVLCVSVLFLWAVWSVLQWIGLVGILLILILLALL